MEKTLVETITELRLAMRHHYTRNTGQAYGMALYRIHQLMKTGDVTVTRLAKDAQITLAAATQMTSILAFKGFIGRKKSSTDKRVFHLVLNPKGLSIVEHIDQRLQGMIQEMKGYLGPEDSAEFQRILEKIVVYVQGKKTFEGDLL